jgi:fructan beta-fructosidase
MVTWSDIPASDGRRLALGWMSNWQYANVVPTEKWRSTMTLPRVFTLHKTDMDYILRSNPVKELSRLEGRSTIVKPGVYKNTTALNGEIDQFLYKLNLKLKKESDSHFAIRLSNTKKEYIDIGYEGVGQLYFINRNNSGKTDFNKDFSGKHIGQASYSSETIDMTIYLDHASVELFADGGQCVMTDIMFPNERFSKIELVVSEGEVELIEGKITELKGIWNK